MKLTRIVPGILASSCLTAWLVLLLSAVAGSTAPPTFKPAHTLADPAAAAGNQFGQAVAFVGGNVLVGARWTDMGGTDAGSAYLFDGRTGELLQTFQKPEPAAGDWFGTSVAAVGDNVLIGALGDDTGAHDAGAAYLFDGKTGELLRTYQKPTIGEDDWFGAAVIGVGENVLVGAPLDDTGAKDAGAAYLFDGKSGTLLRTLRNPAPAADDWFGSSFAVAGERVLIGAFLDDSGRRDAGAAYLFNAATGELLRTIPNPKPVAGAWFSVSMAASDRYLLIGAPAIGTEPKAPGSAFLFDVETEAPPVTLQAPTPTAGDLYGNAVALAGDFSLIGAPREATGKAGDAYLLDRATGAVLQRFQQPTPADGDQMGAALAATPGALVVGAPGDPSGGDSGGTAFLFTP